MAWHVCPDCDGKGTKDNFGAFTEDDLQEWYGSNTEEREEFLRQYKVGEIGRATCTYCNGKRVVDDEKLAEWEDTLEYRAEVAAEQRMGA